MRGQRAERARDLVVIMVVNLFLKHVHYYWANRAAAESAINTINHIVDMVHTHPRLGLFFHVLIYTLKVSSDSSLSKLTEQAAPPVEPPQLSSAQPSVATRQASHQLIMAIRINEDTSRTERFHLFQFV